MEAIETLRNGNRLLEIYVEECPECPRSDRDNIGIISCFEKGWKYSESNAVEGYSFNHFRKVWGYLKKQYDAIFAFPIYEKQCGFYLGDIDDLRPFDPVGVIYTTKEQVKKLCGESPEYYTKEFIRGAFEGELKELSQWAEGDIYGFVVSEMKKCEHCGHVEKIESDSCWGFYGQEWDKNGLFDNAEWKAETASA